MNKIKLIAEIGWNHMGDMSLAKKMIEQASISGADICKFQTWNEGSLKSGEWDKNMGELLSGKTLGIIGLGTIGKKLVKITKGFNLKYIAYDIQKDLELLNFYILQQLSVDTNDSLHHNPFQNLFL